MTIKTVLQITEQYGTAAERSAIRTADIAEGHRVVFNESDTGDTYTIDGGDSSWVQTTAKGAARVRPEVGTFLSQENLALSASSQALASIPATANSALIQVHGGTVTDVAYISFDGSAATSSDYCLRNAQDSGVGDVSVLFSGTLSDIRILGTAGASIATVLYFA